MCYVKEIEDYIAKSTNSVEFFAFDINPSCVDFFDVLKTNSDWQKAGEILNSIEGLELLHFVFHQRPKYNLKLESVGTEDCDLNDREGINRVIISLLKEQLPLFHGSLTEKARIATNDITIGAGDSNTWHLGVNRYGIPFVKLRFAEKNFNQFWDFYEKSKEIQVKIGYPIIFERGFKYIEVNIPPNGKLKHFHLKMLVITFKRMLLELPKLWLANAK